MFRSAVSARLGPPTVLIYVNDTLLNISSPVRLYGDDCCSYRDISCDADCEPLRNDPDCILPWCQIWKMTLKFNKCNLVRVTNKRISITTYSLLGSAIRTVVPKYKYSGASLSSELPYNVYVSSSSTKASRT